MYRYKLILEYDGGPYVGWQRQNNGPSIQAALEEAIEKFCQQFCTVMGCGRTDAGVHAQAMVAHVDLPKPYEAYKVVKAINAHLRPQPIAVLAAEMVTESFHARFSCIKRAYEYRICNRLGTLALNQQRAWLVHPNLNVDAMQNAANLLLGTHDFSTFRDSECQAKSPIKSLDQFQITTAPLPSGGQEIICSVVARSFLHHQVRNMVGTLKLVGTGAWAVSDIVTALAAKDRRAGGPTAPAHGLYFLEACY